jgi:hypothetical protein
MLEEIITMTNNIGSLSLFLNNPKNIEYLKYLNSNIPKDKLVKQGADVNKTELEIMTERGYYRIFDCGSKKWRKPNT